VATTTRQRTPSGPDFDLRTVVEAARDLAFWTLLELIGRQGQTRLDQRMIKESVLFATGHKGESGQIGKHSSGPILAVESRASCVKVRADTQ
jgi:hypothetical protein